MSALLFLIRLYTVYLHSCQPSAPPPQCRIFLGDTFEVSMALHHGPDVLTKIMKLKQLEKR